MGETTRRSISVRLEIACELRYEREVAANDWGPVPYPELADRLIVVAILRSPTDRVSLPYTFERKAWTEPCFGAPAGTWPPNFAQIERILGERLGAEIRHYAAAGIAALGGKLR